MFFEAAGEFPGFKVGGVVGEGEETAAAVGISAAAVGGASAEDMALSAYGAFDLFETSDGGGAFLFGCFCLGVGSLDGMLGLIVGKFGDNAS